MVFEKIKSIIDPKRQKPRHIGIIINGNVSYAKRNGISVQKIFNESFEKLATIIKEQVKQEIPILTVNVIPSKLTQKEFFPIIVDELVTFIDKLTMETFLYENQVKISIFGKWYELPGKAVEVIKDTLDRTKDYDKFFVNLCINYDGYQEIVDACKVIARKVKAEKLEPENINHETIKENIYHSFFEPEIIIKTGRSKKLKGFLVWDCGNSKIVFFGKGWPEFERKDFVKAIEDF
jgi:undecaprenyl diphosphate synthase